MNASLDAIGSSRSDCCCGTCANAASCSIVTYGRFHSRCAFLKQDDRRVFDRGHAAVAHPALAPIKEVRGLAR